VARPAPVAPNAAISPQTMANVVRPRDARQSFVARPTNPLAMVTAQPAADIRPTHVSHVAEPPVGREVRSAVTASPLAAVGAVVAPSLGFSGSFIRPIGASFTRSGD
jgi:hypothetical protein